MKLKDVYLNTIIYIPNIQNAPNTCLQGSFEVSGLQAAPTNHHFSVFPYWPAALVLPKANQFLQTSVQPYISSILEALMEPTSRGFSEVRDVFFRELVEISKNSVNGGGKELTDVSHALLCTLKLYSFDFGHTEV